MIHTNRLVSRPQVHHSVARRVRWQMNITCVIARRVNVTNDYRVDSEYFGSVWVIEKRFEPKMSFFRDADFRDKILSYPVRVVRSRRLYVRVDVDAHDVTIVLETCFATPTSSADTRYYLVRDRQVTVCIGTNEGAQRSKVCSLSYCARCASPLNKISLWSLGPPSATLSGVVHQSPVIRFLLGVQQ